MHSIPFYPDEETSPEIPLERFLPPFQPGAVKAWLRDHVAQGAWVLDPFGSNPLLSLEAAEAGYKVLVVCNNPILQLMIEVLAPAPQREDFQAVLSTLGALKRGDERLELFIQSLYLTNCPNCHRQMPAKIFVWKRDPLQMIKRTVVCPDCGGEIQADVQEADQQRLAALERSPLPAAWAMQQLGDLTLDQRAIVKNAIDVYLPRTLYGLFTLINRGQGLHLPAPKTNLLYALLLFACEYGTSLWQEKGGRTRPKQLSIPNEFVEYNLWQKMEEAVSFWSMRTEKVELNRFPDLPRSTGGICLYTGRLKSILPLEDRFAPSAAFASIPRPNQAFWTLSAVWSGWLLGKDAVQPMHSALERQHYDWYWHTRALHTALSQISRTDPPKGFFVIQTEFTPGYSLALTLAARLGDWSVEGLSFQSEQDLLQILLAASPGQGREGKAPASLREAIVALLAGMAEPLEYNQLFVCALKHLVDSENLTRNITRVPLDYLSTVQASLTEVLSDQRAFTQFGKGTFDSPRAWGLKDPDPGGMPLSERIENEIVAQLRNTESLSFLETYRISCEKFPGMIAPAGSLVKTILASYADPSSVKPGQWQLRPQDSSDHRRQDILSVISRLDAISKKLEYRQEGTDMIVWKDASGETRWVFFIAPTTEISRIVCRQIPVAPGFRVLIVPGGRAELINFRLKRDASLLEKLDGWHLVKFRHIKLLAEREDLNLQTWLNLLDADPPRWQGAEQLPLLSDQP